VALDEVLLEVERLDLVPRDDDLDVGDVRHELRLRPARRRGRLEVAAHTRPQRLRLADVEHAAALVSEQVHARSAWQLLQTFLDVRALFGHVFKRSRVLSRRPCASPSF
jgi:hypothetical protein